MKVSPEHLEAMKAAIEPLDLEETREFYRKRDIPRADLVQDFDKRYRWDLYWHAVRLGLRLPNSTYKDAHIDTALRQIVKPL